MSVVGAALNRDAEMRKYCAAKLHPQKPEWMSSGKAADPKPALAAPKPVVIIYNNSGEATNSQQVVQSAEVTATKLPISVGGATDDENSWKHSVVIGLLAACKHFSEACPIDDTTLEVLHGTKTFVQSQKTWETGTLVLVPKVPGIGNVALKSRPEMLKNPMMIDLGRADADGKVFVLLPAVKLPRKGIDPNKNPDLWTVIPAWLARRSTCQEECNMELQQLPLDSVSTVGDSSGTCFLATSAIVVPVFSNIKQIEKGDEIVMYIPPATKQQKKAGAAKTWQSETKNETKKKL